MSDANDWTAALNETLLKGIGLRPKDVYRSIQLASAIVEAIRVPRGKIRLARPAADSADAIERVAQVAHDEKDDEQIFLGAMTLLAARTKGK